MIGCERANKASISRATGLCGIVALAACASWASAFESTLDAVAHGPMPEDLHQALKQQVESYGTRTEYEEKEKARSLNALERWRVAPWPDLSRATRVRVDLAETCEPPTMGLQNVRRSFNAWKIREGLLLLDDFTVHRVENAQVTALDYDAELKDLVAYANACLAARTQKDHDALKHRPMRLVREMVYEGNPFYPYCVPFHHAHAAVQRGHAEAATLLVRAGLIRSPGLVWVYAELAKARLWNAMAGFERGSSRKELLAALAEIRGLYPASGYDDRILSLVRPLKREVQAGVPEYVLKRPEDRAKEEHIRALVYALRDATGGVWGRSPVGPVAELAEIGQEAIPFLADALDDFTPTRARSWMSDRVVRWRRRMDVALSLIQAVSGCVFYNPSSTSHCFHSETPEKRASVVANVREWWAASKDVSPVQAIRNQIRLSHKNLTLREFGRRSMLWNLAWLEGPDVVLEDAELLRAVWPEEADPRAKATRRFDPRRMILDRLERFWKKESHDWDYGPAYKFGDKRAYEEITRRFMATGKLDPGRWELGSQLGYLAKYGRNWALPILAEVMKQEAFVSEGDVEYGTKTRWPSEVAVEEIQKLTGRDFGYVKDKAPEEKDLALEKAREWWRAEGRETLAKMAKEDHPPVVKPGDLFFSDDEIEACVAAIEGPDADLRRKTVAELGEVFHYRIQRSLLGALEREDDPRERLAILGLFRVVRSGYGHWAPWHLPTLIRVLERDEHTAVRFEAADLIRLMCYGGELRYVGPRLAAVRTARRLAQDQGQPVEVRHAAASILIARKSPLDLPFLRKLAADPAFEDVKDLQRYVGEKEETLRRVREGRDQKK